GMYVFEGRARDATGVEAKKYVVAWSYPAYQEEVVTSFDRVTHLQAYMRQSRQAILQVRAYNRGSVSVVPVCAAVFALPSMYDYDFRSMIEWNAASALPMPNLSQPIYGSPIVSRETRAEVITYLFDIMGVLRDIIYALEPDSLGADTADRADLAQEQYFEDTTSNISTPLHMEAESGVRIRCAVPAGGGWSAGPPGGQPGAHWGSRAFRVPGYAHVRPGGAGAPGPRRREASRQRSTGARERAM
ncbi:unnamed protein product, partial [Effrenium voratum]